MAEDGAKASDLAEPFILPSNKPATEVNIKYCFFDNKKLKSVTETVVRLSTSVIPCSIHDF